MRRYGILLKNGLVRRSAVLLAGLLFSAAAFAQHSFLIDAPSVVGQDEIFRVVFSANGEVTDFKQPSFEGANVLVGPTPSRMSSTQIINGKRTDTFEISYTYVLRPKGAGKVRISEASAVIGGKSYATRPVEIEVVKGEPQASGGEEGTSSGDRPAGTPGGTISNQDVFLRLSFNKTQVVKGEPIIATLKLYTRVPIAGFEDIRFPVFDGFWSQEIETPQNVNFTRESVGNQIYQSAVLRKYMLLPQQTGTLTINPAEMVCQVQVRSSVGGGYRSIFDDFYDTYQTIRKRVATAPSKITVKPLPEGAPASFGGGVGNFRLKVSLSRDSVKAHDAASLLVELSGSGNLNLIESPRVELPADFERYDVKTSNDYSSSAAGFSGERRFEYPFIPRSEGTFAIPPVVYGYYDISKGRYVTLRSDTLYLKVLKGEQVQGGGTLVQGLNKQSVVSLGDDIRYIVTGRSGLVRKGSAFAGSLFFFGWIALIFVSFAIVWKVLERRARLRGDVRRTRNRKANKVARRRLQLARSYQQQNLRAPFYEEMHKALLGYISDKLAIPFADMQRDTIRETLENKGVSPENVAGFMALLEECEMARYSQEGEDGAMEIQYNKAVEVISALENRL